MKTIQVLEDGDFFTCDIGISKEEWLEVLQDNNTLEAYKDTLLRFYYMPKHRGSCKAVSNATGRNAQSLNSYITNFGKYVQKRLGKFTVKYPNGESCYWLVPMCEGLYLPKESDGAFEWKLRPELVEAIQEYLYWYLIEKYKDFRQELPFRDEGQDWNELYKWELITASIGKTPIEIVQASIKYPNDTTKGGFTNLVYPTGYLKSMKYIVENRPIEIQKLLTQLIDESIPLSNRLADFKISMMKLLPSTGYNSKANDERTAATILTCINPDKYTFYKHDVMYDRFCKYLGEDMQKAGACYEHYLTLLFPLAKMADNDVKLQQIIKPMLEGQRQSKLLLAQDILWMLFKGDPKRLGYIYDLRFNMEKKEEMENENFYIKLLETNKNLILTGAPGTGKTYKAKEITAQMLGIVDINDLETDKHFGFVQFHPSYDYTDFVEGLRPKNGDNGNIGFERKDGVFKEFCKQSLSSIVLDTVEKGNGLLQRTTGHNSSQIDFESIFNSIVEDIKERRITHLNTKQGLISVEGRTSLGNEGNLKLLFEDFIRQKVYDISNYTTNELNNRISKLTKGQVQSVNTIIVWAVLQELLKRAKDIKADSNNSNIQCTVVSFDEAFNLLIHDLKESGKRLTFERPRSDSFEVFVGDDSILRIDGTPIKKDLVKSFYEHSNNNNWYSKHCEVIIDYLREHYHLDVNSYHNNSDVLQNYNHPDVVDLKPKKKPFVFIIDEINRGEISKIFGELFFSIDPGYRGEKGKVNTQYQNMIEEGDVFYNGFFVPENVYIIGTMNDIDRSVESMDFAMRRRFAWKEVTAEESMQMLDGMPNEQALKNRMWNLNNAILKIQGLGKAYQIGAAYFKKIENYDGDFEKLWEYHLEGLLAEYLRGNQNAETQLIELKKAYDDETAKHEETNNNNG